MKRSLPVAAILSAVLLLIVAVPAAPQPADEEVRHPRQTRVFDVRDLVVPVRDYIGPTFELQNVSAGGGSSVGTGIFGDEEEVVETALTPEEALESLINLIRSIIEPGTWDDASGNAIRGRRRMIIITHTPEVIEKVKGLLDGLRRAEERMVSVHVTLVRPKADDLRRIVERRLFLAATEKQQAELRKLTGEVVAEGRILCRGGQRVYTAASAQQNFVQDLSEEVAVPKEKDEPPLVGTDPDIGTVQSGLVVDARPVVAEDGTILLDFKCSMAAITGFDNWPEGGMQRPHLVRRHIMLPHISVLVINGRYRLPDGALLFASGGTLFDKEPKGVYALIQVDVVVGGSTQKK